MFFRVFKANSSAQNFQSENLPAQKNSFGRSGFNTVPRLYQDCTKTISRPYTKLNTKLVRFGDEFVKF